MWCAYLFVLIALTQPARSDPNICERDNCHCAPDKHPSWTIVNCTLSNDENLDILESTLPESTTELSVNGGDTVVLYAHSITRLRDARLIHVSGVKQLFMRKNMATKANIVNIALNISDCGLVRIETRAFNQIKGPVTAEIHNCNHVQIEEEALSWILELVIRDVQQLKLGPKAFKLDSTANNFGNHGPGMKIELKNLSVVEISSQTFGSAAAEILLDTVNIHTIQKEAFSANTYNNIVISNSTIKYFEEGAVALKTLIDNLNIKKCDIYQIQPKVLQSAISNLKIAQSRFEYIEEGAINIKVATVIITNTNFSRISKKGLEFSSWSNVEMKNNSFRNLEAQAIVGSSGEFNKLIFSENAIHKAHNSSLGIIGQAFLKSSHNVHYTENYFAETCHCNIESWFSHILDTESATSFTNDSSCTVDEIFARCFNEPDQNMVVERFIDEVCREYNHINCEPYKTKTDGVPTEIKNPIFPDKSLEDELLNARNNKVIAIMIISIIGFTVLVLFISLIKWMKRRGHCLKIKEMVSSNSSCSPFCEKFCGFNGGLDNAGSISQLSVNEYSERHRLNEPRVQENVQETVIPGTIRADLIHVEDKSTQTLPEELTKELLESLREKLGDPENYAEARETIEHLYEIIKVQENYNNTPSPPLFNVDENIYELPFQNTVPRIGRNRKTMVSVGTRAPSIDKLTPISPYNRQTALAHEYFEPKDMAVHLYAEIANNENERKNKDMPDLVGEQAKPRGPYLKAVQNKVNDNNGSPMPLNKSQRNNNNAQNNSTIKSNKSNTSNSSSKMLNRPLPEKPTTFDPGEGTSYKGKNRI